MSTPEDRIAALETWKTTTVDPALGQVQTALTNQARRITTLETAGAKMDARLTKVVNLLKRIGPAVKNALGAITTDLANKESRLPEDDRVLLAKQREEVLNGDFELNGDS